MSLEGGLEKENLLENMVDELVRHQDDDPSSFSLQEIEDKFEVYKACRRMEKLIDELAKGRKMEKILREEKK